MAAAVGEGEFRFFLSCDINFPVTFRVESLDGDLQTPPRPEELELWDQASSELYVECALFIDGVLFGLPTRTRLAVEKPYRWTEPITLSAKYRDLTANAQLAFTVWDVSYPRQEVAVGGACLRLFNSKKQLKSGKQKLRLWRGRVADGAVISSTPGKVPRNERGEVERLEKLLNKYERGEIDHIDWLDSLALKSIDRLVKEVRGRGGGDNLYLTVELRTFVHMVVFQEMGKHVLQAPITSENELVVLWDPEIGRQNPCENKQFKLARSMTRGVIDHDLKPSTSEKKTIFQILKYPPTRHLNSDERELLWKFRFYLKSEKRALTKFLRCVDWSDAQETKQAVELMLKWESIDIPDALELLSPAFECEEVRAHAVQVLRKKTTDEELQCYLLQLVQALRFERSDKSQLALFLVERAVQNPELASFFRWYVTMELFDHSYTRRYYSVYELFQEQMMKERPTEWDQLIRQTELVAKLSTLARDVKNVRGTAQKKIEKLRQLLSGSGLMSELSHFEGLPLPLNPKIIVNGIIPSDSSVFKSALSPLRLSFRTVDGGKCKAIFKKGDDLRQDQLVIQLVTLMDKLLKAENLDLQLTPFRVLATAQDEGIFEYIPSKALAQVLADHKTIINYFRQHAPDPEGPFGISAPCVETFLKSCAGYCVIMYILGVGDRHLDNLLLREDGRLFHVDFGYILGHDPKPFPPPMRLCKEMVEAMGGTDSAYYTKFKGYCCEAYNILRKSSNLILNLFYLMAGANIRNISSDPEKAILKLQEKFRLDLDDGEAVQFFQTLINDSVSALFPQMVETIHRVAQYWR